MVTAGAAVVQIIYGKGLGPCDSDYRDAYHPRPAPGCVLNSFGDSEVRQTNSCDLVWMGSFLFVFQNLAGLGVNPHFSCHTASLDVE